MKKELQSCFEKYYLNGINNKSLITTKNNVSEFNGTDEENTLLTKVRWKNETYPDGAIALYDNEQFYKFLSLYEDDDEKFEMIFDKSGEIYNKITMKGSNSAKVNYYLADPSILEKPKQFKKKINNWDVSFKISPSEVQTILKATAVTSMANILFVNENGISIGSQYQGSNNVDIRLTEYKLNESEFNHNEIRFFLKHFSSILSVIKDEVHIDAMEKLMKISYIKEDLECEYYLAAMVTV